MIAIKQQTTTKTKTTKKAACSADGALYLYEAMDVMNLSRWTLMVLSSSFFPFLEILLKKKKKKDTIEILPNSKERDGNYCISWCQSRSHPLALVVGCGREKCAKIFRYKESQRKWLPNEVLEHEDLVHDVSWAPNIGR